MFLVGLQELFLINFASLTQKRIIGQYYVQIIKNKITKVKKFQKQELHIHLQLIETK